MMPTPATITTSARPGSSSSPHRRTTLPGRPRLARGKPLGAGSGERRRPAESAALVDPTVRQHFPRSHLRHRLLPHRPLGNPMDTFTTRTTATGSHTTAPPPPTSGAPPAKPPRPARPGQMGRQLEGKELNRDDQPPDRLHSPCALHIQNLADKKTFLRKQSGDFVVLHLQGLKAGRRQAAMRARCGLGGAARLRSQTRGGARFWASFFFGVSL